MNSNFGLLPALERKTGKKERKNAYSERALSDLVQFQKLNLKE